MKMVSLQRSMMIYCHQLFDAPLKKRGREDYYLHFLICYMKMERRRSSSFVSMQRVPQLERMSFSLMYCGATILTVAEAARISYYCLWHDENENDCISFNRYN